MSGCQGDALIISNLVIARYGTFRHQYIWTVNGVPEDYTGKTARMQIRADFNSEVIIELTTENDRIELAAEGVINLFISAATTPDLTIIQDAKYDLFIFDSDGIENEKFAKGKVEIVDSITHDDV